MTAIRLASSGSTSTYAIRTWAKRYPEDRASVLVSYAYEATLHKDRIHEYARDWVLDSGAFTAYRTGKPIDNLTYLEVAKGLLNSPHPPCEVFSLDVIGDWRASVKNAEQAWKLGVPVIPTWHCGEPPELAVSLARDYPKMAIGNIAFLAGIKARERIVSQIFARVWPARVHGFGITTEGLLMRYPFHSVDASSWVVGPTFGQWTGFGPPWRHFGDVKMSHPKVDAHEPGEAGTAEGLLTQVRHFVKMEKRLATHWRKELASLGTVAA